jgi:hypothetical protein
LLDSVREISRPLVIVITAGFLIAACSVTPSSSVPGQACTPTVPVDTPPPDLDASGPSNYFGNSDLWVELWPGGVVDVAPAQRNANGSLDVKFPWWRRVRGTLEITARRLDGPTGNVTTIIPTGYGSTGFQASGVSFPTPGCWEVTGRVGDSMLTFVAVIRLAQASSPAGGPSEEPTP